MQNAFTVDVRCEPFHDAISLYFAQARRSRHIENQLDSCGSAVRVLPSWPTASTELKSQLAQWDRQVIVDAKRSIILHMGSLSCYNDLGAIILVKRFPDALHEEVKQNVERLRRDLAMLHMPDSEDDPVARGYRFQEYEALHAGILSNTDRGTVAMLQAFYKSLHVLNEGHGGLAFASEQALAQAYRITLEAAIELGEQWLKQSKPSNKHD